jgi:hypothetical protein
MFPLSPTESERFNVIRKISVPNFPFPHPLHLAEDLPDPYSQRRPDGLVPGISSDIVPVSGVKIIGWYKLKLEHNFRYNRNTLGGTCYL